MDTARMDQERPDASFDLLQVHSMDTYGRSIRVCDPLGCPWQSLAMAVNHAHRDELSAPGRGRGHCDGTGGVAAGGDLSADEVRRRLVNYYSEQPRPVVERILQQKLDDPLSFFHAAGKAEHGDWPRRQLLEWAMRIWCWYLLCLTYSSRDFKSEPGEMRKQGLMLMSIDKQDLQAFANMFEAQITVTHLLEEAWRFKPQPPAGEAPRFALHILRHHTLWTPLLEEIPPKQELVGAVVQLGNDIPGGIIWAGHSTAFIRGIDEESRAYVASTSQAQYDLLVERKHINRVLCYPADIESSHLDGDVQDEDVQRVKSPEELKQIPVGSLQEQILFELVRRLARRYIERYKDQLAGRATEEDRTPSDKWEAIPPLKGSAAHQAHQPQQEVVRQPQPAAEVPMAGGYRSNAAFTPPPVPTPWNLTPYSQVEEKLLAGREVRLVVPCPIQARAPHTLQASEGELLVAQRYTKENKDWVYCKAAQRQDMSGFYPMESLVVWRAERNLVPDGDWIPPNAYLSLQEGEILTEVRYFSDKWRGWARGRRRRDRAEGVFPLLFAAKYLQTSGFEQ